MSLSFAVIFPLIFFTVLDCVVVGDMHRHEGKSNTQIIFSYLVSATAVQQVCGTVSYMIDFGWITASVQTQYALYLVMFTAMTYVGYLWYLYLRRLMVGTKEMPVWIRFTLLLPIAVIFLATVLSPWTKWILWFDTNGVYQRGSLALLQLLCPYFYILIAFLAYLTFKKNGGSRSSRRVFNSFISFVVPEFLGTVLQFLVFAGGYTMIGISCGGILMYMGLYLEEVHENERLKAVEDLNKELRQANEEQNAQLEEIRALNTQLEDNQMQLEENQAQLEEKQSQLEEISAEQEAQIEEIMKLNTSLAENNAIMSSAGLGIWTFLLDENGHIRGLLGNEKCRDIYGVEDPQISPKEFMEHFLRGVTRQEDDPTQYDYSLLLQTEVVHFIFAWNHPKKGRRYIESAGVRHRAPNGEMQMSGIASDVTEQELAKKKWENELLTAKKEAEIANQAKSTFLFNMSHDIRTPMNAIIGYTNLIQKYYDDPEKCKDYLGKIQSSGEFLLSLINNILELARIESGNEKLDEEICDTNCVQTAIVDVFDDMMQQKGITFEHTMDLHTKYVWGDRVKMNQVILNLVSNAYKYTPSGGRVELALKELPNEKPGWINMQTTVRDNGIGMSEEYLPILFDAFSRERNSTESKVQGTGLGMRIVKKLVDMMDGTITVESQLGKGTTFVVTIPNRIAENGVTETEEAKPVDTDKFIDKRVLLAEDNELNAEIAEEILKDVGFKVERAADGMICVDMLKKAESGYYDLILMDVQMPNMDGYEATRTIRAMEDPKRNQIPIIAMTANAFESDRQDALAVGMNNHVAKPIEVPKLLEALAGILQ